MYVCYHTFYRCVSYLITTVVTVVLGNNGHTLTKKMLNYVSHAFMK